MHKVVLFDWDDTLIRTMEFQYVSYKRAFHIFNFELSKNEFLSHAGFNGKEITTKIIKDNNLEITTEEIYQAKQNYHSSRIDKPEVIENTISLLKIFGEKYKTGIVSSGFRHNIQPVVDELDLKVDLIITATEYKGLLKPNPGIYNYAINYFSVAPDECIVFEDSAPGIQAAKDAGIKTIINVKKF